MSPYQVLHGGGSPLPCLPGRLALALFMLRVLANNHHAAFALDDLALFTEGFTFIIGTSLQAYFERHVMRPFVRS